MLLMLVLLELYATLHMNFIRVKVSKTSFLILAII